MCDSIVCLDSDNAFLLCTVKYNAAMQQGD